METGDSPVPWCGPRVPECGWSLYAPSPPEDAGIAGAGEGQEREPRTHRAWASGTQAAPEHRDPGVWGGRYAWEYRPRREPWSPKRLMAPSHGHAFHSSVGSKWQFKGLPGSRTIFTGPRGQFQWTRDSLHGENYRRDGCGGHHLNSGHLATDLADGGL